MTTLPDGREIEVHDMGGDGPVLLWHHGTPQTGALLAPVLAAAAGLRVVSCARPSYGASTPLPGRDVATVGRDLAAVLDADRVLVLGASGGGPHALATATALGDRAVGVVTLAGLAPDDGTDAWLAGMRSPGALRAAREGRAARAAFEGEWDPEQFVAADFAALDGAWSALGADAQRAGEAGPDGEIDDDVAFTRPWGCELPGVPVLVVQGGADRVVPPRARPAAARRAAARAAVAAPGRRPRVGPARRARRRALATVAALMPLFTVEGVDGTGKSTLVASLAPRLGAVVLREPGGVPASECIRALVHDPALRIDPPAEALLYAAARAQMVAEELAPRLARGETVLLDRFVESSLAYQGGARGLGVEAIRALNAFATGGIVPDRTLLLTLSAEERARRVGTRGEAADRIEAAGEALQAAAQATYEALAAAEPERFVVLDASLPPDALLEAALQALAA